MGLFKFSTLTLRLYFQESPPVSSTAIISQRKEKSIISTLVQTKFSVRIRGYDRLLRNLLLQKE